MDKKKLLEKLIEQLESKLQILIQSAHDARDAATHEDSKAENKYDTRGLEASYLAGAQAKRAGELQVTIDVLTKLELQSFSDDSQIDLTSLIKTEVNGEDVRWLFLLPKAGGEKFEYSGEIIQTITSHSPLGSLLLNKSVGDVVELTINKTISEYEVLSLS